MEISRKLNLVIPIEGDDGNIVAYVHSAPISREVFETYFLPVSKTFSAIYAEGLGSVAGPRVAAMMLKRIATDLGQWDGPAGVERGLVAEIRRLTNVLAPGDRGWETLPYDEAMKRGILSSDDAAEVDNAVTFFTVASAMHRRSELRPILDGAGRLWGAQTSSLNSTEFAASLPISKPDANSGEKMVVSSVPI